MRKVARLENMTDKNEKEAVQDNNTIQIPNYSKITIGDVAKALGISKTTVSRAISGKGRIGEATRQKVMEYISEHHYQPSSMAKGLANSKNYNIGWIIPGEASATDLLFFQRCMMGVSEVAAQEDYDLLITMVFDDDLTQLERVVRNRKIDGFVVGRTLIKDPTVTFLKEANIPFVVIGSSPDEDVVQIDNDHLNACRELTSILIDQGIRKPLLVGEDEKQVVNQSRKKGYLLGLESHGIQPDSRYLYMNCDTEERLREIVRRIRNEETDCIVCIDERVCSEVVNRLYKEEIHVPEDVKLASFYSSKVIDDEKSHVTALRYDPKELGSVACKLLFEYMNGNEIHKKTLLGCEVVLKESTN